jgi:hypothetical protein
MRCILYVAGRRLQSLRTLACQGSIKVAREADHEGEVAVDVTELEWLEYES